MISARVPVSIFLRHVISVRIYGVIIKHCISPNMIQGPNAMGSQPGDCTQMATGFVWNYMA